jgi:hypothetical protein
MRKKYLSLLFLILSISILFGCYETEDGDIVEPVTVYEKVNGTWGLSSLIYVDEFAQANNLEPIEQNLTDWFNFSTVVLTLTVNDQNQPTDYLLEGDVPELFPNSGYWELSSPFPTTNTRPITINLYTDSSKSNLTGTLRLISIPGAIETMEFQLQRTSNEIPFISYNYKFFPIN